MDFFLRKMAAAAILNFVKWYDTI